MKTVNLKGGKKCKSQRQYTPQEIAEDLIGYEMIDDYRTLRKFDRVKYIRKDTGEYRKGGLLLGGSAEKGTILIETFARDWRTCKKMKFTVRLDDIILFRMVERGG